MQIMPCTGKEIARKYRIGGYSTGKLTSDPALNVAMGEAYLGDLIDRFGGSYIMAFAGRQCRSWQRCKVDRPVWRSALRQGRRHRLDRINPDHRNPRLRAEGDAERACLTRLDARKYAISMDINRGGVMPTPAATRAKATVVAKVRAPLPLWEEC